MNQTIFKAKINSFFSSIFAILVLTFAFASTASAGTCAVYGRLWNSTVTDGVGGFYVDALNVSNINPQVEGSTLTAEGTGYYFMYLESGYYYNLYIRPVDGYIFRAYAYPNVLDEAHIFTCQENIWYNLDFVIKAQP